MTVSKGRKAASKPRGRKPRKPQLALSAVQEQTLHAAEVILSSDARHTLRQLTREAARQLSPETKTKLRAFAKTHGYRAQDVLEAAVAIAAVNLGEVGGA